MGDNHSVRTLFQIALLSSVLAACGGGGGSSSTGTQASSGNATALSVVSGPISAFGSVFVNGREFGTDQSTVVDDDDTAHPGQTSDLDVGMVVDVTPGSTNSSGNTEASEIHYRALARGAVEAVDCTGGTMQIMGQSVLLTSATNFRDARSTPPSPPVTGCAGVKVGDFVGVFGYLVRPDATATNATKIVATLVRERDLVAGTSTYRVEGPVAAISGSTFTINGLTIDDSAAPCLGALQTNCSGLAVGQNVAALGTTAPSGTAPETFKPTTVRLVHQVSVQSPGASVEVEGVVSQLSGTTFDLRGVKVDASAIPAATVALLANGAFVEVQGTIGSDGASIVATTVTVQREAHFIVEADLEALSHTATGDTIQVLGRTFTLDSGTRFADLAKNTRPFNLTNYFTVLNAGGSKPDHVIVDAAISGNSGTATATSVVRVPASTTTAIAGIADPVTAPSTATQISIQGVPVTLAATTTFQTSPPPQTTVAGFLSSVQTAQTGGALVYVVATGIAQTSSSPEGIDASNGSVALRGARADAGPCY